MTSFRAFRCKLYSQIGRSKVFGDAMRFIVAGMLNTAITLVVYEAALIFFEYRIAYTISWVIGIGIAVIFYPSKVFVGGRKSLTSKLLIMIIYVIVFLAGLIAIQKLQSLGISEQLCIFGVIIFTTITNFLLMRLVLRFRILP